MLDEQHTRNTQHICISRSQRFDEILSYFFRGKCIQKTHLTNFHRSLNPPPPLPSSRSTAASSSAHLCDSLTHLSGAAVPLLGLGSHETLEDEVKRLRQRLHTVETENNALNSKLSQQQWDLDHRLTEIEMQFGVTESSGSSCDAAELEEIEDLERNRESII